MYEQKCKNISITQLGQIPITDLRNRKSIYGDFFITNKVLIKTYS